MPDSEFTKYIPIYKPVCEGLHKTFGGRVEFILHDLSTPESSVVLVVGDLTKRQIGAPATNVLMNALSNDGDAAQDIIGYPSMTKDGKLLKSSTVFLRNDAGKIIGCFCCNLDLTEFNSLSAVLSEITATTGLNPSAEPNTDNHTEIFAHCINEVVGDIIRYEISRRNMPVASMSKADKVEIIRSLDKKGVFDVKGTPEAVAGILGTSVFTIYNYLKEVRNDNS